MTVTLTEFSLNGVSFLQELLALSQGSPLRVLQEHDRLAAPDLFLINKHIGSFELANGSLLRSFAVPFGLLDPELREIVISRRATYA